MRKHRHLPQFHKKSGDWDGFRRPAKRRQHGLLTHVAPAPYVLDRARKRARLYMHSAARKKAAKP